MSNKTNSEWVQQNNAIVDEIQSKVDDLPNIPIINVDSGTIDGSTLVLGETPELPYTELEYIQSTGTQYIDTGIKCNSLNRQNIKFKIAEYDDSANLIPIYGCWYSNQPTYAFCRLYYSKSASCFRFQYYSSYYDVNSNIMGKNSNIYELKIENGILVCNDVYALTMPNTLFSSNLNYYLFQTIARNDYTSTGNVVEWATNAKMNLYHYKVTNSLTDEVILNLIPVIRKSDNVVCMYDKVSKTFFTNIGTGSFIAGPEI